MRFILRIRDRSARDQAPQRNCGEGFSLLEMLVAMSILALLLIVLFSVISQLTAVFRFSGGKVEAFQEARSAFELLTRNIGQATLNTYWRTDNADQPRSYRRASDLHFLVTESGASGGPGYPGAGQAIFFQAPLGATAEPAHFGGLPSTLNALGYFVDFSADQRPAFSAGTAKHRFRLMQLQIPTERLKVFASANAAATGWFSGGSYTNYATPIANNVVAAVFWPRRALLEETAAASKLTTNFTYNSREIGTGTNQPVTANQLPPLLEVALVAIDETAANRMDNGGDAPSEITDALDGLFQSATESDLSRDLETLTERLSRQQIPSRIFRTVVPLRESRWSEAP